jgi:hypothetical protein
MNDSEIREAVQRALDGVESTPLFSMESVAQRAVRDGERLLAHRLRSQSWWWLCAAALVMAFVSVGFARRESRSAALATAEVAWSL